MNYREEIEIVLNRDDKQYGNYQLGTNQGEDFKLIVALFAWNSKSARETQDGKE